MIILLEEQIMNFTNLYNLLKYSDIFHLNICVENRLFQFIFVNYSLTIRVKLSSVYYCSKTTTTYRFNLVLLKKLKTILTVCVSLLANTTSQILNLTLSFDSSIYRLRKRPTVGSFRRRLFETYSIYTRASCSLYDTVLLHVW